MIVTLLFCYSAALINEPSHLRDSLQVYGDDLELAWCDTVDTDLLNVIS